MTAVHGEPRPANLGRGWTVDDSTFGARLALVRQRMQWNIKEAARECGIPAASWGTWENGAMPRRYTEMCRLIAERTGADYGWLVDGPRLQGKGGDEGLYGDLRPAPLPSPRTSRTDEPRRPRLIGDRPNGPARPSGSPKRTRPADNRPAGRARAA